MRPARRTSTSRPARLVPLRLAPVVLAWTILASPAGATGAAAQDYTPATARDLTWESYAVRWGQVVREGDVVRPGLNTIYDTVRVDRSEAPARLHRTVAWRDIQGAWIRFHTTIDLERQTPVDRIQVADDGSVTAHAWEVDGSHRGFQLRSDGPRASWSASAGGSGGASSPAASRTPSDPAEGEGPTAADAFPPGQYGLEFRGLPVDVFEGRILVGSGSDETASWSDFTARAVPAPPVLVPVQPEVRHVTLGAPPGLVTEYWLQDAAPYVVGVRFTQPDGTITEWVITEYAPL